MVVRSIRPALSPYIPNDQTGYLWITTILGVIYTFLVAVARLYVKFRALGIDDYLLGFATVSLFASHIFARETESSDLQIFHMVQSIPIFLWLSYGRLNHISTAPIVEARNVQEARLG